MTKNVKVTIDVNYAKSMLLMAGLVTNTKNLTDEEVLDLVLDIISDYGVKTEIMPKIKEIKKERKFLKNQKVKVNNPVSFKRNGEIATVKYTPEYDSDYVTVVFDDGCSGKYPKNKLLLEW